MAKRTNPNDGTAVRRGEEPKAEEVSRPSWRSVPTKAKGMCCPQKIIAATTAELLASLACDRPGSISSKAYAAAIKTMRGFDERLQS